KFPITALVSESKNYEPYDLDKDKKTTIKAWIGDTLSREFEIGKTTDSYRHTFVKLGGDYRVYQITGDLVAIFNQTIDTLRDKTIFSFDPDKIQEIQITKSQDSITLTRKETPVKPAGDQEVDEQTTETIWLSADGQEPDKLNVASLVNRLSKLFCQAYIYDRTKEDFKNPIYTIKLIGKKEYTLSIFDKTNETAKDSPAVASESNYPFLFNSWLATQITENLDALLNTSGTT
ncbi:MAG TPA: DUF4340 domain-containing protein, partial [Desulfobacterales bacterium]|nr:DUF4340 domain-containing protein [Desulfobacterales bacterium]